MPDVLSLREAPKQLREQAGKSKLRFGGLTVESDPAGHFDAIRNERRALADLLDGGGKDNYGGLFGLHGFHVSTQACYRCGDGWPCPTLTLVAGFVSTILGCEVKP